jgi:hypothetical protein
MTQYINKIVTIQKIVRGFLVRKNLMPIIFYQIKNYLHSCSVKFSKQTSDGRINSSLDEETILELLNKKFKIHIPKTRNWYDFLVMSNGIWFPVNIKTTTMKTSDNTGNVSMLVYAYTNYEMDLYKSYKNGEMSKILIKNIKKSNYNYNKYKDYYFLVLDKNDNTNIVINSIKGLSILTSNNNNLPFQIKWNDNKEYQFKSIRKNVNMMIKTLQKPAKTWKETFLEDVRKLKI